MALTIYDAEDVPQGSDAWYEARAGIPTASTIGKLLTPTRKPADNDTSRGVVETLVAEQISGHVEPAPSSRAMERGTLLEDPARNWYRDHTGTEVAELGFGRLDTDTYTVGASPDGVIGDQGGLEIKCPLPKTHLHYIAQDQVPGIYLPQIHTNLLVFDAAWWDFLSWAPGMRPYIKRVHRDPTWDAAIIAAAEKFRHDAATLTARYRDVTAGTLTVPYFDPFAEEAITFG